MNGPAAPPPAPATAWLVPEPHELLWVSGGDAVTFLDGLLSQAVEAMDEGSVARSLLLSPQGKLRAPVWLLRDTDRIGIVCERGFVGRVADDLGRYRIRVDVAIEADDHVLAEMWGPGARDLVPAGSFRVGADRIVADLPLVNSDLPRVLTTDATAFSLLDEGAAEALRIEHGEPRLGVDIDETIIPQEAGLVDGAVDFSKGCYLGQELVARIDARGHVNRLLRALVLDEQIEPGTAITAGDADVGTVTSAAVSETLGPIALAIVRREIDVGDRVIVGRAHAEVRQLPLIG